MKTIDLSYARTRIAYDPFTGVFTWKAKPVRKSQDAGWNTRFAGTVAGRTRPDGYVVISIDGVMLYAHRLAWAFEHGSFSDVQIDHRDRNPNNNAIKNLREATFTQNHCNKAGWAKSGFKGVVKNQQGKFYAQISYDGSYYYLGLHGSAEEASRVRDAKAAELHGTYANSSLIKRGA